MIIDDKRNKHLISFGDLHAGTVFQGIDTETFYMKLVKPVYCSDDGDDVNAISIEDGDVAYFYDTDVVCQVSARAVISDWFYKN